MSSSDLKDGETRRKIRDSKAQSEAHACVLNWGNMMNPHILERQQEERRRREDLQFTVEEEFREFII